LLLQAAAATDNLPAQSIFELKNYKPKILQITPLFLVVSFHKKYIGILRII
jgi:hypothetical protein